MAGWAALILVVLPLQAHAAGPVGLALDTNTCTNAECYKQRNMTLLRQALLANYDMTAQPPRFNSTRGALVRIQMAMQQFQELDTTNQQIAFIAWWRHYWTDPRLAWNPDHWGGITELTFFGHEEHKQIWTPDTIIYEAIESDFQIPGGVQLCGNQPVCRVHPIILH